MSIAGPVTTTSTTSTTTGSGGGSVLLLVGTKKGAFVLRGDPDRADWRLEGPVCETWPTPHFNADPLTGHLYAGTAGFEGFKSAGVWRSTDQGKSWAFSDAGLSYGEDGPFVSQVWHVTRANGALYAGVEPAGLFRSADEGQTWEHVQGLRDHPSRPEWMPGAGGLCLHSIVADPADSRRMWVGTSAAGTFFTADGGQTWAPRNRFTRNFDEVNKDNDVAGCVHKLIRPADGVSMLYQQNHFGVYRSADEGDTWQEISAGLPSDFGFPMAVHPRDSRTVYVIPLDGNGRFMPEGKPAIWRSRDAGDNWERLDGGLPPERAYMGVLREGVAVDALDPVGVYFGTNTGQLFASRDEGQTWTQIAEYLPPILSVEVAVL